MDERASPRSQTRIAWISLGVLCLGVLVAGAVTLHACYHHTSSLDGVRTPLSPGGTAILDSVGSDIVRRRLAMEAGRNGPLEVVPYSRAGHTVFGAGLAAVLSWACLAMPRWPLHPIGLLIVGSVYAQLAWFSVFLGWAATRLIVRFGGAGLFRRARPVFLGLIAGEVFAAVLWFLVPAVIILCGGTSYVQVNVVPQ